MTTAVELPVPSPDLARPQVRPGEAANVYVVWGLLVGAAMLLAERAPNLDLYRTGRVVEATRKR